MKKATFDSFLPSGGIDSFDPTQEPSSHFNAPTNAGAMPLFEHLSPQATRVLLQRREQHIRRLREGWQAERAHLTGIREQAEAMIEEERAMMDEERLFWAEQKTEYENEIADWKNKAEAAECKVAELIKLLEIMNNSAAKPYEAVEGTSRNRGLAKLAPGIRSPSIVPRKSPSDGGAPLRSPALLSSTMPESKPFVPLDPRMQSLSPQVAFSPKETERIPPIDITDVIPGLEGIRLKAPAVKKSTFNDGKPLWNGPDSNQGSGKPSPNLDMATSEKANIEPRHERPAVEEPVGLLSQPPVEEANVIPSDGDPALKEVPCPENQPTADEANLEPKADDLEVKEEHPHDGLELKESPTLTKQPPVDEAVIEPNDVESLRKRPEDLKDMPLAEGADLEPNHDNLEINFDPSEKDPALKGPLCLRNRPASDEAFLKKLWDKLEEVKATNATPSVLDDTGTVQSADADDESIDDPQAKIESDVPLKFKTSSNFGLPFGHVKHSFAI